MQQPRSKAYFFYLAGYSLLLLSCAGSSYTKTKRADPDRRLCWPQITDCLIVQNDYKPNPAQERIFHNKDLVIRLFSENFAQGDLLQFIVTFFSEDEKKIKIQKFFLENQNCFFTRLESRLRQYSGFCAISPYAKLSQNARLEYMVGNKSRSLYMNFEIAKIHWPEYTSQLNLGKFSQPQKLTTAQQDAITRGSIKKKKAFLSRGDWLLSEKRSHPLSEHYVTSPFWAKRTYMRFEWVNGIKKNQPGRTTIHHGLDLKGFTGMPIFSIMPGKVIMAENLYYEGGFTLIDHGQGLMSGYMHQSEILVQEGRQVLAGDLIGKTGATGMVTGPHLHLFLFLNGIHLSPLSYLGLPLFLREHDSEKLSLDQKEKSLSSAK